MTAISAEPDPITNEEAAQVGGEAHGELTMVGGHGGYHCSENCDMPNSVPTESLPGAVGLGLLIGLLVITASILRRRFWRKERRA